MTKKNTEMIEESSSEDLIEQDIMDLLGGDINSPFEEGLDLLDKAMQVKNKKEKKKYLLEALSKSDKLYQVYLELANLENDFAKAINVLKKGVEFGDIHVVISESMTLEDTICLGSFLKLKKEYADKLYQIGKIEECVDQLESILDYDPYDYFEVRHFLIPLYAIENKDEDARKLIDDFSNDNSLFMMFNKCLVLFRENNYEKFNDLYELANKKNKYVIKFLTGKIKVKEGDFETTFKKGSRQEALAYCLKSVRAWIKTRNLIDYIESMEKEEKISIVC